jgi:hypothetical protein
MKSYCRLPLTFLPARLQADLTAIPDDAWATHFQPDYFEGEWNGVALRSVGGSVERLFPHRKAGGLYADTALLDHCPAIRSILGAFQCDTEMVRLLRLGREGRILEHCDEKLNPERGVVRVHVPVLTNPDVYFYLNGQRVVMEEGESWFLDLALPHRVENRGASDRVHLVIDCCANNWTEMMFRLC